jgi:hypothetical protein
VNGDASIAQHRVSSLSSLQGVSQLIAGNSVKLPLTIKEREGKNEIRQNQNTASLYLHVTNEKSKNN